VLGFVWSLLNPVLLVLTFVIVFKYLWEEPEANYSVKLFATMVAWRFFNTAVMDGANSVSVRVALLKRVSFPRLILPAASLLANFVDFLLALGVVVLYFAAVRVTVNWLYVPLAILALCIQIVFTFGLSLITASLSVFYSDVQFIVGSLFQMWFFLSPVLYGATKAAHTTRFPEILKTLFFLNPMAPPLIAYRSVVPEQEPWRVMHGYPYYVFLAISAGVAVVTAIIGWLVFKRLEGAFAKEG
jgi:ABC-type polysaccharide/polyol phosphate export permease